MFCSQLKMNLCAWQHNLLKKGKKEQNSYIDRGRILIVRIFRSFGKTYDIFNNAIVLSNS